ncbi:MAG: serine/threonine protein kinase, partial [Bacteroidales bacterium]|nr:serine/threonine protein kinase [Bacteroidales bacterium]
MTLEQNTLFHSRYLLVKHLGSGGFSEVWLVEETQVTNRKRALKIYTPGKGLDENGVQIFRNEFEIVCDVNHTNLLRPAHYDVFERSPYLIMPFCERGSASKFIGKISEEQAWRFLHDVAAGLAHLHEQEPPIIHQDIKPDNILMDNQGHFLITDFGISAKARSTLRRSVGEVKMTVAYTPPERFAKNTIIKASDIWSLGATLFELLEGDVPFFDMLGGKAQLDNAEIPEMDEKWSPELKKIVTLCLQKETWDRPTAAQLEEWTTAHFKGEQIKFENSDKAQTPPEPA